MCKLKKKEIFNFHGSTGRIFLKSTFSNLIITFTDMDNKVIICKTSGSAGIIGNKRRKRMPQAIETIMTAVIPYIKLYQVTNIEIVLKMKIKNYFYALLKELQYHDIFITSYIVRRRIAFNGQRGRKIRRT